MGELAFHFKANPDVMFGLMNEPHERSASAWIGSANAAIAAIRAAGAVSQEILVPGSYWDSAWTWTSTDNAAVVGAGVQNPHIISRSRGMIISTRTVAAATPGPSLQRSASSA